MFKTAASKLVFIALASLVAALGPMRPAYAINDRNNEMVCRETGNVDPRCF
jgi:hypothetical protein